MICIAIRVLFLSQKKILKTPFLLNFHYLYCFFTACLLLLVAGCTPMEEKKDDKDKLLAKVANKALYLSELEGMFPEHANKQDSTLFINAFVESWVRESVMMNEAEHNIPKDLNIDKLVRDYRASLILHNYEKKLIELRLDSTINQQELNGYYEKNKEQFQLDEMILRCYFMKLPVDAPNQEEMKKWWNNTNADNYKKLLEYCTSNAEVYMLKDSSWYNLATITNQLPNGIVTSNNISSKNEWTHRDSSHLYFLKINERIPKNRIAPLSYIENQAKKVILHKRKLELLDKTKEEMYEKEVRRNNVKIYTN